MTSRSTFSESYESWAMKIIVFSNFFEKIGLLTLFLFSIVNLTIFESVNESYSIR